MDLNELVRHSASTINRLEIVWRVVSYEFCSTAEPMLGLLQLFPSQVVCRLVGPG